MTREVRYLETEFYNAKENSEIETFGSQLRCLGRRLLDLAEDFVPRIELPKTENGGVASTGPVKKMPLRSNRMKIKV